MKKIYTADRKQEIIYCLELSSEKEFKVAVKNYISFYNSSRPHTMLKYKTPDAFEAKFFSKIKSSDQTQSNTGGSF